MTTDEKIDRIRQNVRDMMVEKDISQYRIAKETNISQATVHNFIAPDVTAKAKIPNLYTLLCIADGIGVEPSELMKFD